MGEIIRKIIAHGFALALNDLNLSNFIFRIIYWNRPERVRTHTNDFMETKNFFLFPFFLNN